MSESELLLLFFCSSAQPLFSIHLPADCWEAGQEYFERKDLSGAKRSEFLTASQEGLRAEGSCSMFNVQCCIKDGLMAVGKCRYEGWKLIDPEMWSWMLVKQDVCKNETLNK